LRTVVYLVVERDAQSRQDSWPPALPIEPVTYMENQPGKQRQACAASSMWVIGCMTEHCRCPASCSRVLRVLCAMPFVLLCQHAVPISSSFRAAERPQRLPAFSFLFVECFRLPGRRTHICTAQLPGDCAHGRRQKGARFAEYQRVRDNQYPTRPI
jgi:hypothetical protein